MGWVLRIAGVLVLLAGSATGAWAAEISSSRSESVFSELVGTSLDAPAGDASSSKLLSGVPAYDWYHGCGPTAVASIIGYYDLRGYSNLFDAEGWDQLSLTANVQDQISSPAHNARYDPMPDDISLPVPPKTSIAGWFRTSVFPLAYGESAVNNADDAFRGYAEYRGYECVSENLSYDPTTSWDFLVEEIDNDRPVMFLVDSSGNGSTDHFVPVLGYDDRGADGRYYACYTTESEDETVQWRPFRGMSSSWDWGVGYITYAHLTPEPATVAMLSIGAGFGLLRRSRRRDA